MAIKGDDIASLVLEEFRKLPAKRKPAVRDNGLREWVPLSGIVVKGEYTAGIMVILCQMLT
jgi:tRNA-specific adenosine deaminase 1